MGRGKATVQSQLKTDIAHLNGDLNVVKAFEVLKNYSSKKMFQTLSPFAKTSIEVCEGQQYDMNFENTDSVLVNDYLHMISLKTAVLLGCSLQMGAICAEATEKNREHIYLFGKHLGIAFQLMDDVLDAFADDAKFGKQVGGDIISNKKTFLLLKAFELADENQKQQLNSLLALKEDKASEKVKGVLEIYSQLNIKSISEQEADIHTKEAIKHLDAIEANVSKKQALESLAMQLLNRQS